VTRVTFNKKNYKNLKIIFLKKKIEKIKWVARGHPQRDLGLA
jgi:hypothetical protein